MERPKKQVKTLSPQEVTAEQSQIINDLIPLRSTGALILLNVLKNLDVESVYAICGPYNKVIHAFCKKHEIWKAYAREILGDRLFEDHERVIYETTGCVNYRWMMLAHVVTQQVRWTLKKPTFEIGETKFRIYIDSDNALRTSVTQGKSHNDTETPPKFLNNSVSVFRMFDNSLFGTVYRTKKESLKRDDLMKIVYQFIENGAAWNPHQFSVYTIREEISTIDAPTNGCTLARRKKQLEFQRENDELMRQIASTSDSRELMKLYAKRQQLVHRFQIEFMRETDNDCGPLGIAQEFPEEISNKFGEFAL